jgi:hypothetical protein
MQVVRGLVKIGCDERNERIVDKNNLNVAIDPDILEVIENSTSVSTQKGNSAALLKI